MNYNGNNNLSIFISNVLAIINTFESNIALSLICNPPEDSIIS
jgi:hypothetical protein